MGARKPRKIKRDMLSRPAFISEKEWSDMISRETLRLEVLFSGPRIGEPLFPEPLFPDPLFPDPIFEYESADLYAGRF